MTFQEYLFIEARQGRKYSIDTDHINIDSRGITTLEGIEVFKNLRDFSCDRNLIVSLEPLKGLTKLNNIYCEDNLIKSLKGIENLEYLVDLYCNKNDITSLKEIANLKYLRSLCIDENKLPEEDYDMSINELQIKYKAIIRKEKIKNALDEK